MEVGIAMMERHIYEEWIETPSIREYVAALRECGYEDWQVHTTLRGMFYQSATLERFEALVRRRVLQLLQRKASR